MLLIAGGERDPNIACLRRRLAARGIEHLRVMGSAERWPRLTWSLTDDVLTIDGVVVRPDAVFVRFDVFEELADPKSGSRSRAASWYYAAIAWAMAHDEVRLLNRRFGAGHVTKPYVLHLARQARLVVADTLVTNDLGRIGGLDADDWIIKPVDGGELTVTLREACQDTGRLERLAGEPAFLQRRLEAPDRRIFRVGDSWYAFDLVGGLLDYRAAREVVIQPVEVDAGLVEPLARLMDQLGLDFGAADFKRCPATGAFTFLEVNSAPMFAAFDRQVAGRLADAIIDWLMRT